MIRLTTLTCLIITAILGSALQFRAVAQSWLQEEISKSVKPDYERNCDSIVDAVRQDTRARLSVNPAGISVEQIYNRKTLVLMEKRVKCSGTALLSNGKKSVIKYGAYRDAKKDIILTYSLE